MLADHDPLISMQHIEALAKVRPLPPRTALAHIPGACVQSYSGPRTLAMVAGHHSSPRNRAAREFVMRFLQRQLKITPDQSLRNADHYLEVADARIPVAATNPFLIPFLRPQLTPWHRFESCAR